LSKLCIKKSDSQFIIQLKESNLILPLICLIWWLLLKHWSWWSK